MRDFHIDLIWTKIQIAITALGGWLGYFLGGLDGLLIALLVFVALDYVTGVMCAISDHKLSSAVGFRGICRKVLVLMLVGIGHILDVHVVGTGSALRTAVICFYVETDCSALVRVCCAFAGITSLPAGFCTANEPTYLGKTGAFTELKGSKYTDQSAYLGRGDILVTKVSGHTVVVLTNGSKYEGTVDQKEYIFGERTILHGCEGRDVKTMQECLLVLGYDLGKWGANGDFGDATDLAVKAFQKDSGITVDGKCGFVTIAALLKAMEALDEKKPVGERVVISGGNCYVRSAPSTEGKILGVAHKGEILPYAGETSANRWLAVWLNGVKAWVSGKYSQVK